MEKLTQVCDSLSGVVDQFSDKLGKDINCLVLCPLAIQNVILPSCFMVILSVTGKQKILCQISFIDISKWVKILKETSH